MICTNLTRGPGPVLFPIKCIKALGILADVFDPFTQKPNNLQFEEDAAVLDSKEQFRHAVPVFLLRDLNLFESTIGVIGVRS